MKITDEDLQNRFTYHPPTDPKIREQHETARGVVRATAYTMVDLVPEGREASLMVTHLEEALFWANAAIARQVKD